MTKTSENLSREINNLKYTWNRLPSEFLISFFRTGNFEPFRHPQHIITKKVILDYLASLNRHVSFDLEERRLKFLVDFYLENYVWLNANVPLFRNFWRHFSIFRNFIKSRRLRGKKLVKPKLLDIGCGAGNYFGDFKLSKLSEFITYEGVDIAEKNIFIAKKLYPKIKFEIGNIISLPFPNSSYDIILVSHVFEHLSTDFLDNAINEAIRVTKDLLIINFFNEKDIPEHIVRRVKACHWNTLARERIKSLIPVELDIKIIDSYYGAKREGIKNGLPTSLSTWLIKKDKQSLKNQNELPSLL